jgi:hypothetical protein
MLIGSRVNQPYFNTDSLNSQSGQYPFVPQSGNAGLAYSVGHSEDFPEGGTMGAHEVSKAAIFLNLINTSLKQKKAEKVTRAKIVVSGKIVQVYEYEKTTVKGIIPGRNGYNEKEKEETQTEAENDFERVKIRMDNVYRAKTQCKRLINANAARYKTSDKFVTLTFSDEITDLKTAMYEFKKFHQRLEYQVGKVQYVCVPEIQWKRFNKYGVKVWHFHALFFGLDSILNKTLRKIWGLGFVRINAIDRVDDLGSYVTKYMEKSFDMAQAKDQKRYFASKGLRKSTEYRGKTIDDLPTIPDEYKVFSMEYDNEKLGHVKFTQYRIDDPCDNKLSLQEQEGKFYSES